MDFTNTVHFELSGRYALFTDPLTGCGGEKCSLPVPTFEALKGAARGIYSSRDFCWTILAVRIMHPIITETMTLTRLNYFKSGRDISVYTYLRDVRYQVLARLEFAQEIPRETRLKHFSILRRMLKRGGRRMIYLGTASCPAEIALTRFGTGEGYYDGESADFGLMYHSISYRSGCACSVQLFQCRMQRGIIVFPTPQDCPVCRTTISNALV